MMRSIYRFSVWLVFLVVCGPVTIGQPPSPGEPPPPDELVFAEAMQEYIDVVDLRGKTYATLTRREVLSFGSNTIFDTIFGHVVDSGKDDDRILIAGLQRTPGRPVRDWDQAVFHAGGVYFRIQANNTSDWIRSVDKTDLGELRKMMAATDLRSYMLPVVNVNEMHQASHRIDWDYAKVWFDLNSHYCGVERDDQNRLVGVWRVGEDFGSYIDVTLGHDSKRPIQTVYRRFRQSGHRWTDREKFRIFSIAKTQWERQPVEGSQLWLPRSIQSASQTSSGPRLDVRIDIRWSFGDHLSELIPKYDADVMMKSRDLKIDWREPIRKAFDEDWERSYQQHRDVVDTVKR